jgi:predicted ATPase
VLSSGNASESPTVLCARREMASWKLLQLEPSALRRPSEFTSPTQLGTDGLNLAAALDYLARTAPQADAAPDEAAVYCEIANRLSELIGGVHSLRVDHDEKRELLTLVLKEFSGTEFPASALSDGTLRFLALAVLETDSRSGGVICLEEPENGIHPARIPAMLRLLQDVAGDVEEEVDAANPLRQVIVNTHSPAVVGEAPEDSLLVAEAKETLIDGTRRTQVRFACLPDTWRANAPEEPPLVAKGQLLAYLNPRALSPAPPDKAPRTKPQSGRRKVRERADLPWLPFREAL